MRLVFGLGNPGPQYQGTRHNVGFEVLDHLARREGVLFQSARHLDGYRGPKAFSFARLDSVDALLVKPETFMNRSGEVVAPLSRFADPASGEGGEEARYDHLLVVYDDLDLDPGRLRIRPHGGAGGQNGMRSIVDHLGSNRFPRLRVGIGRPGTDAARYVLGRFSDKQQVEMEISYAEAAEAVLDWLTTGDLAGCMTRFHSRWNQGPDKDGPQQHGYED